MTIREFVKHILPSYPVKLRDCKTGEIIEEDVAGYFYDSKDPFYRICEVQDWTVWKNHVDIGI